MVVADSNFNWKAMKLLLVGATGLVGREVLRLALADTRVSTVVAPVRKALPPHAKLHAPLVDFDQLPPDAPWWQAHAVICTLGTTMKVAGTRQAFLRVDHDYPLAVARLALAAGTRTYALNSAAGANAASRIFYNRVKGELEDALSELDYESVCVAQPSLLAGERGEFRLAERLGLALGFLMPERFKPVQAAQVAAGLLAVARDERPGWHVLSNALLRGMR